MSGIYSKYVISCRSLSHTDLKELDKQLSALYVGSLFESMT